MASAETWAARIGVALSLASRWQAAASLVLTLCALVAAPLFTRLPLIALALVAALGAVQIYLALRIEFDRAIFAAAVEDGFAGFDEALERLGWRRGNDAARSAEARAAGLARLVRWSGSLLVAQFALLIAGLCLR